MSRLVRVLILSLLFVSSSVLAVTVGVDEAKSIARLYSAAFDRNPDVAGLNFWIDSYEAGRSIVDIARDFYNSPEFTKKYGALSDLQYVQQLYQNVLGRPGEEGGINFWTDHLANGVSRAKILAEFAESPENISKTAALFADMRVVDDEWVFEPVTEPLTELVKDIAPGTESIGPWNLFDFKNRLYFTGLNDHMAALWRSDGSEKGTVVFKTFVPDQWGGDPGAFVVAGDKIFFRGTDHEHGTELWVSDGTPAGTMMTRDIRPNDGESLLSWPVPWKGGALFIADDGESGPQFWISDGTEVGTRRFEDSAVSTAAKARNFWSFKDGWLFKATDAEHGAEMWRTDGTEGGSELVKDIVPGPAGSFTLQPFSFAEIHSGGIFWVWNENNVELWRTDGTEAGTSKFWVLSEPDAEPYYKLISYENKVIFFLERPEQEWEMWCTDGTEAGTEFIRGGFWDEPMESIEYNGLLFLRLITKDQLRGYELWRTDCTEDGTRIAFEINPGSGSSSPNNLTVYDGLLYFNATDGILGKELYRTNGTAEGTEMVADINLGEGSSDPDELTVSNGMLFYSATEPYSGRELYRTIHVH